MTQQSLNVLRTFRLDREVLEQLQRFLHEHPEVGSLNHLVNVALREFASIHERDKTWLRLAASKAAERTPPVQSESA